MKAIGILVAFALLSVAPVLAATKRTEPIKVEIMAPTESLNTTYRSGGLIGAIQGNVRHEIVFQVNALVNGEHARLQCDEHHKGCTAMGPGIYDAELKQGANTDIWITVVLPVSHKTIRDHWVVSGTW